MSTSTETENIKTSGIEKVLAAVLAIFIVIGGVWAYSQIGKISEESYTNDYGGRVYPGPRVNLPAADRAALKESQAADNAVRRARRQVRQARNQVSFTGEAYRTELDAGLTGKAELDTYRGAQKKLDQARKTLTRARQRQAAITPAAAQARKQQNAAREELKAEQKRDDRLVFGGRFLLVTAMLGAGIWGMSRVRRRRSRMMPLALAQVSAAAALAAWMAIDYGSRLGVFREIGPLAISVIGIILTVTAFVLLQGYLSGKIPLRRLRRGECPFCGFPGRGNEMCEGCGRRIIGECSTCHQPRRTGSPHCGNCGSP